MLLVALPLNASNELNNITILQLRGDYFFHILMFIPWMFFQKTTHFKAMHWLLPGLLFASVSEGLQYFLPYRAFNINDLIANATGVLLGFLLARLITKATKANNHLNT